MNGPYDSQYFRQGREQIRLDWDLVEQDRLRKAQLGAAWAIGSHATHSAAPAQIVLPTGVGKTALITLAPFLIPCRRVLVVTPGRLVRDQVASAFKTLADLVEAGVIPEGMANPRLVVVRHRAREDDWTKWEEANVVVGTVNVLSHGYPEVRRIPEGLFDLVIFDEAHHLPAPAWEAVLRAVDAPAVLFTATPFRRDGQRLPGELVFSYPLQLAMADGVYAPVHYRRVEPGEGEDPDTALADAAKERLEAPEHLEAGSRLLVRAGQVKEAAQLVELYAERGVQLGLVEANSSAASVRKTIARVNDGELAGFACVGSLVEGFDFPALKIAAYHHPHRSLAPTLQFVGRLARVGPGVDGELLAIPTEVQAETRQLYQEDRAWQELLPEIVDAAVDEERRTRQHIREAVIHGPVEIPPLAIAPPKSARIYRTAELELSLDIELGQVRGLEVVSRFFNPAARLISFVTRRIEGPRWLRTDALDASLYQLHLACWVREARVLFVSTESNEVLRQSLAKLGAELAHPIGAEELSRLLWEAEIGVYHSVGMRSTRPGQASRASYRMLAGRSVGEAIGPTEAQGSALGHVMGRPAGAQGSGTIGFSVKKAKLWEPDSAGSFLGFREWCEERAAQLTAVSGQSGTAPQLDVPIGDDYDAFPARPVAAVLDHVLLQGEVVFSLDGDELHPAALDIDVDRRDAETLDVALVRDEQEVWRGSQDCLGGFEGGGDLVAVERASGQVVEIAALLQEDAPIVFFSDGSTVQGRVYVPPRHLPTGVPSEILEAISWDDVDIEVEHGNAGAQRSIHEEIEGQVSAQARWLVTDHGARELADFVAVADEGDRIRVTLIHCKASSSPSPGHRVDELYEVLGQAMRSVRWAVAGAPLWAELRRRLSQRPSCRLVSGAEADLLAELQQWEQEPPAAVFEMRVVQPGLSAAQVPGWDAGSLLILSTYLWCRDTDADFRVLCSA